MADRMVNVGGYRLAVSESGDGTPPVVFCHGLTGSRREWNGVRDALGGSVRQVAYSRPARGGSEPLPPGLAGVSVPVSWGARQMHALLDAAGIPSPRVIAGHSLGALLAIVAGSLWPADVAGLVLVDASETRSWIEHPGLPVIQSDDDAGGVGFDMLATHAEWPRLPPAPAVPAIVVSSSVGRWLRAQSPPEEHAPHTLAEIDDLWQAWQREYANRFDALHVISASAGHTVHIEQPDLVALAVRAVLEAVRSGARPVLDPDQVQAAGGLLVRS